MTFPLFSYENTKLGVVYREGVLYDDIITFSATTVPSVGTIPETQEWFRLLLLLGQYCRQYNIDTIEIRRL